MLYVLVFVMLRNILRLQNSDVIVIPIRLITVRYCINILTKLYRFSADQFFLHWDAVVAHHKSGCHFIETGVIKPRLQPTHSESNFTYIRIFQDVAALPIFAGKF